jgi:hypothetical protein
VTAAPLSPHEVFGFAPYWILPTASKLDVSNITTLAYFSVDVNSDGTVSTSGSGWKGYQSQALADLVTRAHGAGAKVVLTATCFDQSQIDQLTNDPAAANRLATTLVSLVAAKNLDGVNIDFEGLGDVDRAGLVRLMSILSTAVHTANAGWQLSIDTYGSSAGDRDMYDVAQLASSVDTFFVMAYDMDDRGAPTPTAPISGPRFTDTTALEQYTSIVPAAKVILGVPFYGYDWPTAGPGLGDPATGPPGAVTYAQVMASGHPIYWDPVTQTPWTSYPVGTAWHETWFDDPTSVALKVALAGSFHLRGVGAWALGMDGGDPAMMGALLGHPPSVPDSTIGPPNSHIVLPSASTSSSVSTTTSTSVPQSTPTPPTSVRPPLTSTSTTTSPASTSSTSTTSPTTTSTLSTSTTSPGSSGSTVPSSTSTTS